MLKGIVSMLQISFLDSRPGEVGGLDQPPRKVDGLLMAPVSVKWRQSESWMVGERFEVQVDDTP